MKFFLSALLALPLFGQGFPMPGPGMVHATTTPIALIAITHAGGINGATTGAIDTTGATTVLLMIVWRSSPTLSISDSMTSPSNTYTQRSSTGSSFGTRIYECDQPCHVGSGHTFTVAGTGGAETVFGAAWSGTKTSSAFDQENHKNGALTSTWQTNSITPTLDSELIVALGNHEDASGAPTIDSGMTVIDSQVYTGGGGTNAGGVVAWKQQGTAAAINPTWSDATGGFGAAIASFKIP